MVMYARREGGREGKIAGEEEFVPMLSNPKKPPEKMFLPRGSLRFTHLEGGKEGGGGELRVWRSGIKGREEEKLLRNVI